MSPNHTAARLRPAVARAPGKIILFGEHAVVHGQPAIAAPLRAVQASAEAQPAAHGSGLTIHVPATGQTLAVPSITEALDSPLYEAVVYPAQLALEALHADLPDLTLTVRSSIPIASGLGSGAALAAAIIRALASALGASLNNDVLNSLVYEAEKRHHGTPSGIDNTVIVYEQAVYFVRGMPPERLRVTAPLTLLVADTGYSSPTHLTVADVRALFDAEPERVGAAFERIGRITQRARAALEGGRPDALGPLMNENHTLLCELTVSSDELDRLCDAARDAGATGAKLSGGGRGGSMIALVDGASVPRVAQALLGAGAVSVFPTTIQPTT